ncbi:MAG: SMI1/KNR4 family protein [Acidobacteriota bacterium]
MSKLDELLRRLHEHAGTKADTRWHSVVSAEGIAFIEESLGVELPPLLRRCYTEVSNGGFGPGYGLIGLPGGHPGSWGDLLESTAVVREDEEVEEGWLPVIDWGCAEHSLVDCDAEGRIVSLYDGDYHEECYDLEELFTRWLAGEVPDLTSGGFCRSER